MPTKSQENKQSTEPAPVPPSIVPEGFEKLDDEFGEPWKPETKGDSLSGTFVRLAYVPQQGRVPFTTHVIRNDQGTFSVASAILERRMSRIPEGTEVVLVYQGLIKMKTSAGSSRAFDVYYPKNTELKAAKPPELGDEYQRA
jgi:hypothetical protein